VSRRQPGPPSPSPRASSRLSTGADDRYSATSATKKTMLRKPAATRAPALNRRASRRRLGSLAASRAIRERWR
jgi:hypothetical protein